MSFVRMLRSSAAALAVFLVLGGTSGAQSVVASAALSGAVADATGAALADVRVTATQVARAQEWTQVTDARGHFRFPYLPFGAYTVVVEHDGFEPFARELSLSVGSAIDLPIVLAVAGVQEAVTVSGTAAVDVSTSQLAEQVTPSEIASLPLNGRNYLDLALLTPGVTRTNIRNTERFAETSAVPGTGISVAGQRNIGNTFIVDGLSANDDAADLAGTYYSQDVIQEFEVITSGAGAEFGRTSSGSLNIVTRSGANRMSGSGYGFFRGDRFDARNAFATSKAPLSQQQFGASVGGPLRRDHTFYFANVEATNNDRTGYVSIPQANVDRINRTLDALAYAGPRVGTGAFATGYDTANLFARVDHQVSPGRLLSARYTLYDISSPNARSVGALNDHSRGTSLDNRDQNLAVMLVTTWPSGLLNELRGQFVRSRLRAPGNDLIGPAISISGVANFGAATSSPTARDLDVWQASNTVTLARDEHLVKTGADVIYNDLSIGFPGAVQGAYTFSNAAAFEAGRYTTFQQAFGEPVQVQGNANLGLFVQDEWRATPSLTFNGGLRYDLQSIDDPVRTDTNNVSPRVGFAWAPGSRDTVVRGSAGLYFDRIPLRAVSNALQRDGEKYKVAVLSFGQAGAPVFPAALTDFPTGVVTATTTIDSRIPNARSVQASLQVERALPRGASATAAVQYLKGDHIIMSRNLNVPTLSASDATAQGIPNLGRPDPRYANVSQYQGIGQSDFVGLTVSARAPLRAWGQARVSYTLGRARDDAGNAFFSSPQDNFNVHGDWGPTDNDQRHRLVLSGALQAPPSGGWSRLAGLQLAWLYTYGTAQPFNVLTSADANHDTNVNDRPTGVGRNTGAGFDFSSLDLRLGWRVPLLSRVHLDLSVDAFNVLNRTNLLFPNATYGTGLLPNPSFGRATAAADPRQLQFGARVSF